MQYTYQWEIYPFFHRLRYFTQIGFQVKPQPCITFIFIFVFFFASVRCFFFRKTFKQNPNFVRDLYDLLFVTWWIYISGGFHLQPIWNYIGVFEFQNSISRRLSIPLVFFPLSHFRYVFSVFPLLASKYVSRRNWESNTKQGASKIVFRATIVVDIWLTVGLFFTRLIWRVQAVCLSNSLDTGSSEFKWRESKTGKTYEK